jgi:hypothetical protein
MLISTGLSCCQSRINKSHAIRNPGFAASLLVSFLRRACCHTIDYKPVVILRLNRRAAHRLDHGSALLDPAICRAR